MEQLHNHVVALDPDKRLRRQPGYAEHEVQELLHIIETQGGKLYVAEDDSKFLGFTAGFMTKQSDENLLSVIPTKLGVVSDVFVSEEARGKGLGQTLLEHIEIYLKSCGADTLWINIVAFNDGAHNFYKKHGYHDREIGLMKRVT